jgi:hypothetical protein
VDHISKAALWYQKNGFSVIPVMVNKRPYIKWEQYQTRAPGEAQVRAWWKKWPTANIGIVTGTVSGIDVVDCDSDAGKAALEELLPENLEMPIVKTPKGYHFYFSHRPGLSNGVRIITDCDLRTNGGYVIAPPSVGKKGRYMALPGLKISEINPAPMPDILFKILQQGGNGQLASSSEHIKDRIHSSCVQGDNKSPDNKRQHLTTSDNIAFQKGGRDNALFHLAYHLVKGGMPVPSIEKYMYFLGAHCSPPFPEKEIKAKIHSALNRTDNREKSLTQEIRDLFLTTSDNITTTFVYQVTTLTTREDRNKALVILGRLVKEGFIERVKGQNGVYRRIDSDCEPEDWQNADVRTVDLWLPFNLTKMISISPGSIILVAGAQDAGKSALLMNIAKSNRKTWNVHYFSSELNSAAFKGRVSKFSDITPDQFNVKFYQRSDNFQDVIKTGAKDLNLIDYLEVHTEFYRVSEYLARIHQKIGQGIAVVAIQKDPNALNGRGGSFTQEKPVLSLALDYGVCTITKFKGQFKGSNPRGQKYKFKLYNGCEFSQVLGWHKG